MRKAFDRQRRLDCPSVNKVPLNLRCRHEIVPILHALQHIYSRPQVRDRILHAIARDVNGESNARRGRPGLDYWEILVLAAAHLGCNCDYDELQDLAENHRVLRQVMGIGDWSNAEDEEGKTRFDWRRIRDNVTRLRPETIARINEVIVQEGHRLEPIAAETVRGDSFVAATDVHFPTDNSLLRDGLRKILGLAATLAERFGLVGWRQHQHLYRKARKLSRAIERIAARKGNDYRVRLQEPFITHYSVLPRNESDRDAAVRATRKAQRRHRGCIRRASLDRGFHSPENQKELARPIAHPCLPLPGVHQSRQQERT